MSNRHEMARNAPKCCKYCMGKFMRTRNLMMRTFKCFRTVSDATNPKYPKIHENGLKWQEILSNVIHFAWMNLPVQGI